MVSTGGAGPGAGSPQEKKKRAEARAQRHHGNLQVNLHNNNTNLLGAHMRHVTTLLKLLGTLLYFGVIQCIAYFLQPFFGEHVKWLATHYWWFVVLALIPAVIAKCKGGSFWGWWMLASWAPVISILFALEADEKDRC